ncbi:MAG: HAMP domain-containing histidine kinase [Oscillospiraceae bacterium]|nr:HAMP domain-containing histidine kinase [Oscillospiraceae bacterium]
MSITKKLRVKFVAVFMISMLVFAVALSAVIYYEHRAELERDCMVYLLNINNYVNTADVRPAEEEFASYPPYFVLEISDYGEEAEITLGDFFLADQGLTAESLMDIMSTQVEETGVLSDYNVRYYNGVRQSGTHRISFIDIDYITSELNSLLLHIALFVIPSLGVLFLLALLLSWWFAKPAKDAMEDQRRFISSASHELKTPISIITTNMDLLSEVEDISDPNYEFCCDNIRHECDRMSGLVGAMLWLALPGSRDRRDNAATVDFSQLLEQEALRFEVMAFDQKLALEVDCAPNLTVRGDATQVTRVIDVLVENALKYCAPDGSIKITAAPSGSRRVIFTVASTGQEIPREVRDSIFKPFYQIDSTRHGAGLGLSIAQEIVSSMHGSIKLEYRDGQNCFVVEM